MHIEVKQLAPAIRDALKAVNYGARDIEVKAEHECSLQSPAGSRGARGFTLILNLDTGRHEVAHGDWGGAGLGRNMVDYTDERVALADNMVVITGSTGWPRTFARIHANPSAVGKFLPSGAEEELSDVEQQAIYCFAAIKGGQYRRDEMRRRRVTEDVVESLIARGYLSRNRAGATQITTKGKNARTVRY